MLPSYNAEELKSDIRLICDANPQPMQFIIGYVKAGKEKEVFATKADFGKRVLELIANPRTNNISFFNYKTIGSINRLGSPCRSSFGSDKKADKNLEFVEIRVETKADAAARIFAENKRNSDHRFEGQYQGD